MTKEYFIRCRQTCTTCNGDSLVINPYWEAFSRKFKGHNPTDAEIVEWWNAHGFASPFGQDKSMGLEECPPEERVCNDCNGKRLVEREIALKEALNDLGFSSGLPQSIEWALNSGDGVY